MKPRVLDILKRLMAFDTVSSESNMGLIEYVRDLLLSKGIESLIVKDETGKRPTCLPAPVPRSCREFCCPGTPTWCRQRGRPGPFQRFRRRCRTAGSTAVAVAT